MIKRKLLISVLSFSIFISLVITNCVGSGFSENSFITFICLFIIIITSINLLHITSHSNHFIYQNINLLLIGYLIQLFDSSYKINNLGMSFYSQLSYALILIICWNHKPESKSADKIVSFASIRSLIPISVIISFCVVFILSYFNFIKSNVFNNSSLLLVFFVFFLISNIFSIEIYNQLIGSLPGNCFREKKPHPLFKKHTLFETDQCIKEYNDLINKNTILSQIAEMTHDIKKPFSMILVTLEMFEIYNKNPEAFNKAKKEIKNAINNVNNRFLKLLTFAGTLNKNKKPASLSSLLETSIHISTFNSNIRGINCTFDLKSKKKPLIDGNSFSIVLIKLFDILIKNINISDIKSQEIRIISYNSTDKVLLKIKYYKICSKGEDFVNILISNEIITVKKIIEENSGFFIINNDEKNIEFEISLPLSFENENSHERNMLNNNTDFFNVKNHN
ncbi:MAG: HAMP domain-containing histidine kinase [Desulfobacterales bacterium]|nr:HAMP domain-containing histidine kinase [Desulfobacterales bacterium]